MSYASGYCADNLIFYNKRERKNGKFFRTGYWFAIHENIEIISLSFSAPRALVLSHGGYTPMRSLGRKGSGKVIVPDDLAVYHNTGSDNFSIGTRADHLLSGAQIEPFERCFSGSIINNYSLVYNHCLRITNRQKATT